MIEKLVPIDLPPGFFHNGTKYEAKGRWYDGHLVRWHQGALQPVGGWSRLQDGAAANIAALTGTPSAIMTHQPTTGLAWVVVGTTTGLWAVQPDAAGTAWTDITPASWAASSKWQFDTFGDLLIATGLGDYKLYTWDGNLANDAVAVGGTPTQIIGGIVASPERFIFVLGASNNPRKVQWPDQETTSTWTPTSTNQAGDIELQTQGELVTGVRVRGQTLLFTNQDVWSATYIGGQFVYSFRQEGDACGIASTHAVAVADSRAFWMGKRGFFQYDGWVRPLECDVYDKVFVEDLPAGTIPQPVTWANTAFNEIWWFYSTTAGGTNNRYVKYNYRTNVWDYGALGRQAVIESPSQGHPLAVDSSGVVWKHESGQDRGSEVAYIESGPFELTDGDRVMRIQRIVPDEKTLGQTNMSIYTALFPTDSETTNGPYTLAAPTDVRLTARQIRVKITEVTETGWRVGKPRLGIIPMGRR
jgi:hypothetical protein